MSTKMTEAEMRAEIARLAPFFHNVELPYGLRTWDPVYAKRPKERVRVENMKSHVWPLVDERFGSFDGLRVLDAASNAGGFSVEAARSGAAEVLGIEIVDHYLEQARFIKRALELEEVEFRQMRIEELTPERDGVFDLVFCFDVLYHLEDFMLALRRLAAVTRGLLVLETRVAERPQWKDEPLWLANRLPPFEDGTVAMATGRWRTGEMMQFTPTPRALEMALAHVGFDEVVEVPLRDPERPNDLEVQALFTAWRG